MGSTWSDIRFAMQNSKHRENDSSVEELLADILALMESIDRNTIAILNAIQEDNE